MKDILELIQRKGQEFGQLELFELFKNSSITAKDKMLWVPYFSPFIMGFSELNKSVFRKEATDDKLQEIINQHTYEDESHWVWFLKDIEILGLDKSVKFTDSLKFLWSEDTKYTRLVCQQIAIQTQNAEPVIVIIAIQCLEETFKIGLSAISPLIKELEKVTERKFYFFGEIHTEVESNHSNHSKDVQVFLETLELTPEQNVAAREVVDSIFKLMTNSMNELLRNARQEINNAKQLQKLEYSR